MSESEVWKDVTGYEGLYMISDKGSVHSVERRDALGRKQGGFTLIPKRNKNGYLQVHLYENGMMKGKWIHRLVAEAFVPNPKKFSEVNHRDEVKDNNELSNLEWCDRSYNTNYGTRNKRISQKQSKKVRAVNIESGEIVTFNSVREARDKGYFAVSKACRGVYKNSSGDGHLYKGHKWYYQEEEINEN